MNHIAERFIRLKTAIGGNREKSSFEFTMGRTMEEGANITGPSRANTRILAELELAMHLSIRSWRNTIWP